MEGASFDKLTSTGNANIPNITGNIIVNIIVNPDHPETVQLVNILFPHNFNFTPWIFNDEAGVWESNNGGQNWTQLSKIEDWNAGYAQNSYFSVLASFYGYSKTISKDISNSDKIYSSLGSWAWSSVDGGQTFNNISMQQITPGTWLSTGVDNIVGHGLDVNDTNRNIVYMGGYDIGYWYSRDHGQSWRSSLPVEQGYSWSEYGGSNVSTLLNDPAREGVVWASFSAEQYTDLPAGKIATTGLFKSTSYGENWQLIGQGEGLPVVSSDPITGELEANSASIRMYGLSLDINSAVNNRTLYMTLNGDVYKSITDGQTWSKKLSNKKLKFTEVDKKNSNLVYAGGEGGLWHSVDAGEHWNRIGGTYLTEMAGTRSPMREEIVPTGLDWKDDGSVLYPWEGIFDIQADPNVANRVYVTAFGEGKGLYRSDDVGLSWSKLRTDKYMRGVAVAPQSSNIIYVTSSESYFSGGTGNSAGIQYSTDGGVNWTDANEGMAWNYGGTIEVETGISPHVWAWSPGTGVQHSVVPGLVAIVDTDGDGIADASDNCTTKANSGQRDTDQDGYGNVCDADLDNSGFVNLDDFDIFVSNFGTTNPDADFDASGFVNLDDFDIFVELFGAVPGPKG